MTERPGKSAVDEARERARRALAKGYVHVRTGVREGVNDARLGTLQVPPRGAFVRLLIFGVSLPGNLLRLAWRSEESRRSIRARLRTPVAIFGGTTLLLALHLVHALPGPIDEAVADLGGALSGIAGAAQSVMPNPVSMVSHDDDEDSRPRHREEKEKVPPHKHLEGVDAGTDDTDDDDEATSSDEDLAEAREQIQVGIGQVAARLGIADAAVTAEGAGALDAVLQALADPGDAGPTSPEMALLKHHSTRTAAPEGASAAPAVKARHHRGYDDDSDGDDHDAKEKTGQGALGILGALYALEWILIWIWREHHDAIACEVSALLGIPSEAMQGPPKLRFDAGFLRLKAWRALRFFLFTILVLPGAGYLALLLYLCGLLLGIGSVVGWVDVFFLQLALLVTSAYWAAVFGAANTFLAWEETPPGWEPKFLVWTRKLGTVPIFGLPMRAYARFLVRTTKKVWPACRAFEDAPVESIAMMVGKGLVVVPGVYLVLRPMFGPAATHLLLARRARDARADGAEGATAAAPGDPA
jgi:hypothetical protein